MESETPMVVGLYASLADAQAAQQALADEGLPEPRALLETYDADDDNFPTLETNLPGAVWAIVVLPTEQIDEAAVREHLQQHNALTVGTVPAPQSGLSDVARGSIAWGHFVYSSPASSPKVTAGAGTSGRTGIANTGALADDAKVEPPPPVDHLPDGEPL